MGIFQKPVDYENFMSTISEIERERNTVKSQSKLTSILKGLRQIMLLYCGAFTSRSSLREFLL